MVPDDVIFCFYDNSCQISNKSIHITIVTSLYLPPASAGQMEISIRFDHVDNQSDPVLQATQELNMLFFFNEI